MCIDVQKMKRLNSDPEDEEAEVCTNFLFLSPFPLANFLADLCRHDVCFFAV